MPRLPELLNELSVVAANWYNIGIFLNVNIGTLKAIQVRYRDEPKDCLRELLLCWLKEVDPKPSWEIVCGALKAPFIKESHLAQNLEKKYCGKAST